MNNSRTENVMRNVFWAFSLQIVLMLLQLFSRTVFIRRLGSEYLGFTGLFADIIWIICMANLRIPDAIVLCMYKPLSENNKSKIVALLYFLRKACFIISIAIFVFGLLTIPLLPFLIKDPPNVPENFTIMYLFFLFQAVASYLIIYKRFIIYADQKDYIINIYQKIFHFVQIVLQIIILFTIRNFYIFILAQTFSTITMNIMLSNKAGKMYPYINNISTYKLSKHDMSDIFNNIKSMFIYGFGSTTLIGIDSLLVSSIVGIKILGFCSNYLLIINSVKALIDQIMNGFTASIGNLNSRDNKEATENAFNQINFIVFIITAFFSINLAVSLNSLIKVWLGDDFIISQIIVISLVLRFYIQGTQYTTFTFRSTLGLLKKLRYIPIATAIVNVALSIVMGHFFGVTGIFFASSIAIFFFTIIPEALLLYKAIFIKNSISFFIRYFGYLLFMACNYLITNKLLCYMQFSGWNGFFLKAIAGAIISGLLFIIVFFKDKYFRAVCARLRHIIRSKYNSNKNVV